jgi:sarcosine oxidase
LAPRSYDVAVLGLGVVGGAAAAALARRGLRVLGLDRFTPPHAMGSSHGHSRVIREAYFEHPLYVPLVRRAYDLWDELARDSGQELLVPTGLLSLGPPEGTVVAGARRSAREHGIPHEELATTELRARFPALTPPADATGLLEQRAGLLHPERCVSALLDRARSRGAELRTREPVLSWAANGEGVVLYTASGEWRAQALVIAAGPWAGALLSDLDLPLTVERQVVCWFETDAGRDELRPPRLPIVLWEHTPGRMFYVTPDTGDGVKAAFHHGGETTAPDAVREVHTREVEEARALLARLVPAAAAGSVQEARTCLYTNTPDGHFLLDRHPRHRRVVIASPCSGHGFKFAPAVGEAVADLLAGAAPRFDLAPFAIARLRA